MPSSTILLGDGGLLDSISIVSANVTTLLLLKLFELLLLLLLICFESSSMGGHSTLKNKIVQLKKTYLQVDLQG